MFILLIFFGKGLYMEFVEKIGENKYKIKSIKSFNQCLIQMCSHFGILDNYDEDIIINVKEISDINHNLKKFEKGRKISKFIYSIGLQMFILLDFNLSIKYFDISDFLHINEDIFLFVNYNKLFKLLPKDNFKEKKKYLDYKYGIIDDVNTSNEFLSPEVKRGDRIVYYSNMYYSFALIIQKIFYFNVDDIYYTKTYFLLKRCLNVNPFNRDFIYI